MAGPTSKPSNSDPVVTRAAENFTHEPDHRVIFPLLPLAFLLSPDQSGRWLVGAVGIEPSSPVQTRKLFIPRSDKNYKNDRNAEVRYTAGTQCRLQASDVSSIPVARSQYYLHQPAATASRGLEQRQHIRHTEQIQNLLARIHHFQPAAPRPRRNVQRHHRPQP
jgi:hypothetical protein